MAKPLLIDLFAGLGGWSRAFITEGWDAIGFDIERHDYGSGGYPAQLVLQDVCTLEGRQIADADCIVASSPCQEFSYRAMPWKQARALSPDEAGQPEPSWWEKTQDQMSEGEMEEWKQWRERFPKPPPILGIKLFWQAFRLQREILEATGTHVPLVAENVRGAQRWVSPAKANFGSFFLWGDIFQHGNRIYCGDRPRIGMEYLIAPSGVGGKVNPDGTEHPVGSWFKIADSRERGVKSPGYNCSDYGKPDYKAVGFNTENARRLREGHKNPGFRFDGSGRSFQSESVKNAHLDGGSWFNIGGPGQKVTGNNPDGRKQEGSGPIWFDRGIAALPSSSPARKAASAMIAMIPYPLAEYVARACKPHVPHRIYKSSLLSVQS